VLEEGRAVGVDFAYDPGSGVVFHKRVRFVPNAYQLEVELALENAGSTLGGERSFRFTPAAVVPRSADDSFYVEPRAAAAWRPSGSDDAGLVDKERKDVPGRDVAGGLGGSGAFSFGGVHSKYFALLLHPHPDDPQSIAAVQGARYRRLFDSAWGRAHPGAEKGGWAQLVCDLDLSLYLPEAGKTVARRFEVFAGPKEREVLVDAWPDHQELIDKDLGMFDGVAKVILGILGLYEGLVGNFGFAIILMTLTVRLLLFPVNRRSQTSMARYQTKMKRIQPKLEEIKKRYEKDPTKLRQEQARIMQEEGAFPPLGGCLPILLQMPVFFGLFQALRVDFDLRHAPFMLWMHDLSLPDRLMKLGVTGLPLLGNMLEYLNVLPILMIALWIVQQRAMPKPSDEQQARMQRMMVWMPILFGVFLYNYAAGLSLYMITSSSLGIFEMRVIKKLWPVDEREAAKKKPSGWMARVAEMQKEQIRRMESQRGQNLRRGSGGKGKKGK
jgi:YidC/Oxa1 family membrane protein insertase